MTFKRKNYIFDIAKIQLKATEIIPLFGKRRLLINNALILKNDSF